jgi:hypothetical protein
MLDILFSINRARLLSSEVSKYAGVFNILHFDI